jgi:hypothetical protein
MMRNERLFTIWQALANTRQITGASMAEIVVWRGGMSYFMAWGRRQFAGDNVPLIAIDTLEGHPDETIDPERDPYQRAGDFSSTSRERAQRYLSEFPNCEVIKGEVTKLLPLCRRGTTSSFISIPTSMLLLPPVCDTFMTGSSQEECS